MLRVGGTADTATRSRRTLCFTSLWTMIIFLLIFTWLQQTQNVIWTNPATSCERLIGNVTWTSSLILDKEFSTEADLDLDRIPSKFRERFRHWNQANSSLTAAIGHDHMTAHDKYLIYRCDDVEMRWCGGWADRINGVLLAYVLANITGRVFKLEMLTPPCDILHYVSPNRVSWSMPHSFHKDFAQNTGDFQIINMVDNETFYHNIWQMNFTRSMIKETVKYVYFQSNLDHIEGIRRNRLYPDELSWMSRHRSDQIYSALYRKLFKLSPRLRSRMDDFMKRFVPTAKHRLICAQLRMGKNPTIPMDKVERLQSSHLSLALEFLLNQSSSSRDRVFVMTDSECVASLLSLRNQSFGHRFVHSGGPIVHIERHRDSRGLGDMCQGWEKVIFDQHVLIQCHVLLISWSGIGRMAARIRGSEEGLYCLTRAGRIVPCKIEGLYETLRGHELFPR